MSQAVRAGGGVVAEHSSAPALMASFASLSPWKQEDPASEAV